jgi:excisionase family DNA binding protein
MRKITPPPADLLLSVEETALRLGLRVPTIRLWIGTRRISHVKLGRRVLVPTSEVGRLIEENLIPAERRTAQ